MAKKSQVQIEREYSIYNPETGAMESYTVGSISGTYETMTNRDYELKFKSYSNAGQRQDMLAIVERSRRSAEKKN